MTVYRPANSVTVWSLSELAQWPVAAAYTTRLAPPEMTGRYVGARSLCYGLALLLAPLAGAAVYGLSPAALWAGCGAAAICAAAVIAPGICRTPATRTRPEAVPAPGQSAGNRHEHPPAGASPDPVAADLCPASLTATAKPW